MGRRGTRHSGLNATPGIGRGIAGTGRGSLRRGRGRRSAPTHRKGRVVEQAVEIPQVLPGQTHRRLLVLAMGRGARDRLQLVLLEAARGVLRVIAPMAEFLQGGDGAVERGAKLLDEVAHARLVEPLGVVAGAGAGQNPEVGEMLAACLDDAHALVLVVDGDNEERGLVSSRRLQELRSRGIAVVK